MQKFALINSRRLKTAVFRNAEMRYSRMQPILLYGSVRLAVHSLMAHHVLNRKISHMLPTVAIVVDDKSSIIGIPIDPPGPMIHARIVSSE